MNIIFLAFVFGDSGLILGGIIFCVAHANLSALMFYLVDLLQRRYGTRSVVTISGVLNTTPNLAISILAMLLVYAGVPGSLKFSAEFLIFLNFFDLSPALTLFLVVINNFFGVVSFSKV